MTLMNPWQSLIGKWHGEMLDIFLGAAWTVEFEIDVGWSGRATGLGVLTSLMPGEETQPVKVRGLEEQGELVLNFSAPDRFQHGVSWQHGLEYDSAQETLIGMGFSWESPNPGDSSSGEPGGLWLAKANTGSSMPSRHAKESLIRLMSSELGYGD